MQAAMAWLHTCTKGWGQMWRSEIRHSGQGFTFRIGNEKKGPGEIPGPA